MDLKNLNQNSKDVFQYLNGILTQTYVFSTVNLFGQLFRSSVSLKSALDWMYIATAVLMKNPSYRVHLTNVLGKGL